MDKVSVIIPTYNRSHTLKRAVESVLGQTFDNFELLIVDDGSEDDTKSVVDSIQDKRIRYIKLKENRGAAGARNEGVRRSECSLIAFQDSDDVWRPEKLERQMIYWEQHPECALVYCDYLAHAVWMKRLLMSGWYLPGVRNQRKGSSFSCFWKIRSERPRCS